MSIGPSSLAGSISGSQLPAARGTELDKNRDEAAQQVAQSEAAKAAGADGALHENAESSDRDADGRSYGPPLKPTPENDALYHRACCLSFVSRGADAAGGSRAPDGMAR